MDDARLCRLDRSKKSPAGGPEKAARRWQRGIRSPTIDARHRLDRSNSACKDVACRAARCMLPRSRPTRSRRAHSPHRSVHSMQLPEAQGKIAALPRVPVVAGRAGDVRPDLTWHARLRILTAAAPGRAARTYMPARLPAAGAAPLDRGRPPGAADPRRARRHREARRPG